MVKVKIIDARGYKILDIREIKAEIGTQDFYKQMDIIEQEFKNIPDRCLIIKEVK